MADLDTRSKRASSVGVLLPFVLVPPLPDGAFSQGDRQHIAWSYSGVLSGQVQSPGEIVVRWSGSTDAVVTFSGSSDQSPRMAGISDASVRWVGSV